MKPKVIKVNFAEKIIMGKSREIDLGSDFLKK